jgi:hypothetical protein
MTPELIECAIDTTRELFTLIDTDAIADAIDAMPDDDDAV